MSKSKEEAAVKQILQYLIDQNRPYSVIDIFNNLHKEHGKTVVIRALDQLVSEQKIVEKTYGKQKVYFANQNDFPQMSSSDLQSMDIEINQLNEQLSEAQREIKVNENVLGSLENSLTTKEALKALVRLQKEIPLLDDKLKTLQSSKILVKPEEQRTLHANKLKHYKEWQKRKRIANDMLDTISENYPNGKKQLLEEIGVETDEYYTIPKF